MHFTIIKGTAPYNQLMDVKQKIKEARKASRAIVEELGAREFAERNNLHIIAGGISAILFEKDKVPTGWVRASGIHQNAYCPHPRLTVCKEIRERIKNLPTVPDSLINKAVGFKEQSYPNPNPRRPGSSIWVFHPVIEWRDDNNVILMSMDDEVKYHPLDGIVEITTSEYKKLLAKNNKKKGAKQ